ncbi:MAG: hypothetical protein ACREXW_05385 [Gammaproteobacteria bacterium]
MAICGAAAAALPYFSAEFLLPEFKEGHYVIRMLTAPGTSTQASLRLGTAITHELLKNPRVRSVARQVGRAEQGEDTVGLEFSAPGPGDDDPRVVSENPDPSCLYLPAGDR